MRNFTTMYLRPGQIWKDYRIMRKTVANVFGTPKDSYEDRDESVRAVLAEAQMNQIELYRHMWDQSQHSLTHTMVVRREKDVRKGDMLSCEEDNRSFLVLHKEDVAVLGLYCILYLEERNDIR